MQEEEVDREQEAEGEEEAEQVEVEEEAAEVRGEAETADAEGDEQPEAETKKRRTRTPKEHLQPRAVPKALGALGREVTRLKRRVNIKRNQKLFEASARDPKRFDALLALIDRLRELHTSFVEAKKRAPLPRYLVPAFRQFMRDHPGPGQPELPRLSKGKGLGTKRSVNAYIYWYLAERCTKVGAHEYELDEPMRELVLALVGEEHATVDFGLIPRIVTATMVPSVEPLPEDVKSYALALEFFDELRVETQRSKPKPVRKSRGAKAAAAAAASSSDPAEGEIGEEPAEEAAEEEAEEEAAAEE
jgi:hypothetical protein